MNENTEVQKLAAKIKAAIVDGEPEEPWDVALCASIDRLAALAQPAPQVQEAVAWQVEFMVRGMLTNETHWMSGGLFYTKAGADEAREAHYQPDTSRITPLYAAPASPPVWVLVPVEPTEEMLEAAAIYRQGCDMLDKPLKTSSLYAAMLGATPHPPGDTKP